MRIRPLIMIVEDEPDVLLVLRISLEAEGFDTTLAADGVTALHRIQIEKPDLVLLDLMLPVMDGWSVLAELSTRRDPPPVIVCTAKRGLRDVARAQDLGAAEYVTKPFDVEHLTALIGEVLERRLAEVLPEDAMIDALGTQGAEQA
jgi:two-component system, OmpR family, response regulator RegX3